MSPVCIVNGLFADVHITSKVVSGDLRQDYNKKSFETGWNVWQEKNSRSHCNGFKTIKKNTIAIFCPNILVVFHLTNVTVLT